MSSFQGFQRVARIREATPTDDRMRDHLKQRVVILVAYGAAVGRVAFRVYLEAGTRVLLLPQRKTDWEHKFVQFFGAVPAICLLGILPKSFQNLRRTVLAIYLLGAHKILGLRPAFFQGCKKWRSPVWVSFKGRSCYGKRKAGHPNFGYT